MTGALSLGVIGGTALPTFAATNQQQPEGYKNLDTETQQKVENILSNLQQELADLGVFFKKFNGQGDKFANLDEEAKAQVEDIIAQVKDGSLTQEEANSQLEALGVSLPDHNGHGKGAQFDNLDDETKEEVETLMEEAKEQLDELGVDLPTKKFNQIIE